MGEREINKEATMEGMINNFLAETELEMGINEMFHGSLYRYESDEKTNTYIYVIPGAEKSCIKLTREGEILRLSVDSNKMFRGIKDVIWCDESVRMDDTRAQYKDGILTIIIPKILKKSTSNSIEIE